MTAYSSRLDYALLHSYSLITSSTVRYILINAHLWMVCLAIHLNFFHRPSGVLILWGALFRLLVAENVSHFAFKGNSVYRVVTGSVPQKIL